MNALHLVAAFFVGWGVGSVIAAYGTWKACHDNAIRYFLRRGYGPEEARREADRTVGVEGDDG